MTTVKTVPDPRPVAVGDVIVNKPFGGRVMARGRVHLVTESSAYFYCVPRSCHLCAIDAYDSNGRLSHSVWRTWLDWYREGNEADLEVRDSLSDRAMRIWDANTGQYVSAPHETEELRKAA